MTDNIEDIINELNERLYENQIEGKISSMQRLVRHPEKHLIFNETAIISAIIRTLGEEHRNSMKLTRLILSFLVEYIQAIDHTIDNFTIILNHVLKIFKFEFERFGRLEQRQNKLSIRAEKEDSLIPRLSADTLKINKLIANQNLTFIHCLELIKRSNIFDILEQDDVYFNKFSDLLVKTLDRDDHALNLLAFQVLDNILNKHSPEVSKLHLALRMERFFVNQNYLYPYSILARLFQKGSLDRAELKLTLPALLQSCSDKNMRMNLFNLLSFMSIDNTIKETLISEQEDKSLLQITMKLVKKKMEKGVTDLSKSEMFRALVNTLINLTTEPKAADKMMENPVFQDFIEMAIQSQEIGLLKIINNATYFCNPEQTKKMKGVVIKLREVLKDSFASQDIQLSFEILGILSNCVLGSKWEGFLDQDTFKILKVLLSSDLEPKMKLQAFIFIAQICQSHKNAAFLASKGFFERVMYTNLDPNNREECFQFLYVIYHVVHSGVDIVEILNIVISLLEEFMIQEFREKQIQVVGLVNELCSLLEFKYLEYEQNPEVEQMVRQLMITRFSIYNENWEMKVGIEQMEEAAQIDYDSFNMYNAVDIENQYFRGLEDEDFDAYNEDLYGGYNYGDEDYMDNDDYMEEIDG